MGLSIDSTSKKDALKGVLGEARRADPDASIGWDALANSIDGGNLALEDCYGLTCASKLFTGQKRYRAMRDLLMIGAFVDWHGDDLIARTHFPLEENWQRIWEKFANTQLSLDALDWRGLLERGAISFPQMVDVIRKAKAELNRQSTPVVMHATGSLLLKFFADDRYLGLYEITKGDGRDVHPEAVIRSLSDLGAKDSVHLLFNVLKDGDVDPILRCYAVQLAFFLAKHKSDALIGTSREFFIKRVLMPALKDAEMFHVYTIYLALRLLDPSIVSELRYEELSHYPPMPDGQSKIDHFIEVSAWSSREELFESVLEGLGDVDGANFKVVPFDMVRPRHVLADYLPDRSIALAKGKYGLLKNLASRAGFSQRDMWRTLFKHSQDMSGPANKDIVMLDVGDGLFHVVDGHHRIAAAILGAANGAIPPQWLTEIPAMVWTTRELPAPLMHDITTMGVELVWPDLFPGDERVRRFFDRKGGGPSGGGSGGGVGDSMRISEGRHDDIEAALASAGAFDAAATPAIGAMGAQFFVPAAFMPLPI